MVRGLWGKKIGMTQVFSKDEAIPVTAIDTTSWVTIGEKTQDRDGYRALIVGRIKDRYKSEPFNKSWIKEPRKYFSDVREIEIINEEPTAIEIGKPPSIEILAEGDAIDASGITIGRGFAGVVKRHGFAGAPASHGATMGKRPGSIGFMTAEGRVIKGKKLPGRLGGKRKMIRNLEVIKVDKDKGFILVKGSVPGKPGSLIFIRKI